MRRYHLVLSVTILALLCLPAVPRAGAGPVPERVRSLPDSIPPPPPGVTLTPRKPPPDPLAGRRFHVSFGVAMYRAGTPWKDALRDAGFGDTYHYESLYSTNYNQTYPRDYVHADELYFMEVSLGIKRWLATCISMKWNEPFGSVQGFRADPGTDNTEGTRINLKPSMRSYSLLIIVTTPKSLLLSAGAGPSLTYAGIDGNIHYDDGRNPRSFAVDDTRIGFTLRGSLELPAGVVRFGVEAQYNYVGDVDVTAQDTADPEFPTTGFGFSHSYLGLSVGLRL
jgi:hypothetical protein